MSLACDVTGRLLALPDITWVRRLLDALCGMSDAKVYTALLRLKEPWYISMMDADVAAEAALVFIAHRHEKRPCPGCGKPGNVRDYGEVRTWRHRERRPACMRPCRELAAQPMVS